MNEHYLLALYLKIVVMKIVLGLLLLTLCINTLGKSYCIYVISFAQPAVIKMGLVWAGHSLCGFNSSPSRDSNEHGPTSVNKENRVSKAVIKIQREDRIILTCHFKI